MLNKVYDKVSKRANVKPAVAARVINAWFEFQSELAESSSIAEVDELRAKIGSATKLARQQRQLEQEE